MRIAVVGAGWYGCHLANELKKAGHEVVLYEKNSTILSKISGNFGIRLHAGPHYLRSVETRRNCISGLEEFKERYPDLVSPLKHSIYGLGTLDADGNPPKVSEEEFLNVCKESESCHIFSPQSEGYQELITAVKVDEPSIALGARLRQAFSKYLSDSKVELKCNFDIQQIKSNTSGVIVTDKTSERQFDKVINTTSYQAFLPDTKDFPFEMEVVYQPCLALIYEDKTPDSRPFSFIVMDGWFPCIMPICDGETGQKYILTHGKWTIMGSYKEPDKANRVLAKLDDQWINQHIKPNCEHEINRFWPAFAERFHYVGWKGTVLAKLKTKKEFRSAVTYEKDNVIHVVPGKISDVFNVEREVHALLHKENVLETNGYLYVQGGVLQQSCDEIAEKPSADEQNTCNLQTFDELQKQKPAARPAEQQPAPPIPTAIKLSVFDIPRDVGSSLNVLAPPPTPQNITASDNTHFVLSCLDELTAYSALLALSLLALPFIGVPATALIASAATLNLCFNAFGFFFDSRKKTSKSPENAAYPELSLSN